MSSKKRRGRPRKYEKAICCTVYLPHKMKNALRELSYKTGRSMSELVIDALIDYIMKYTGRIEMKKEEPMGFLTLRLPVELMDVLEEMVRESGRSKSELIREAIQKYRWSQYVEREAEEVRE